MDEAELCQRVGLISEGRLLALDTPGRLKETQMRGRVLEVNTAAPEQALRILQAAHQKGTFPAAEIALYGAQIHAVVPDAAEGKARIAALLHEAGFGYFYWREETMPVPSTA